MSYLITRCRAICVLALAGAALVLAVASSAFAQTPPSANRSQRFGPDRCGPADPSYISTANATGGIPMFLQPSEIAKSFQLVRESTRNNVSTVFWATGSLDGSAGTIKVPVDSVTSRITFTFSTDTKGTVFKLTPPSGRAITQSSSNIELSELNCGRILTVTAPEAGEWGAEITGKGRYWMEAQAQSDIFFVSVEFVRPGGRPGHQGLFQIPGEPIAGTPATLEASLSAAATKSTEFSLVNENGQFLQELPLHAVNADREFLEFVGTVNLPSVPFRVAVAGIDSNGKPYQRFFPRSFHAESVEVLGKLDFDDLRPGGTRHAAFTVRNIGAARTFNITVSDGHQFVSNVEPKQLSLAANQSATVRVELTVPPSITPGIGDDLVIVAASTSGPPTRNSNVLHLAVSAPSPAANPH
jgi:hypothetical protein